MERVNQWFTLVANVGVVAGLFLLAYEINQNSALLRSEVFEGRAAIVIDTYRDAMLSPDFAAIYEKNLAGERLSNEELRRLKWFQLSMLKSAENVHFQHQLGILGAEYQVTIDESLRAAASNPQMMATFAEHRAIFNRSFQQALEGAGARPDGAQ